MFTSWLVAACTAAAEDAQQSRVHKFVHKLYSNHVCIILYINCTSVVRSFET